MNIHTLIQNHRAAQAVIEAAANQRKETIEARISTMKSILKELMKERVHPMIQAFCADLIAENIDAHAIHSEEERGGDELHTWIVCAASLVIHRGPRRIKADLQFVGSVTPENWKITAFHHFPGPPDVDATPNFIGAPAEIESFVTRETESFLLTLFPS